MTDQNYVEKLEQRIDELENVIKELKDELIGYCKAFEVYFLLYDQEDMIDDCVKIKREFSNYQDALDWTEKYFKRKKKRKYFNGIEITEKTMQLEITYGRFWTFDHNGKLSRHGDENKTYPTENMVI